MVALAGRAWPAYGCEAGCLKADGSKSLRGGSNCGSPEGVVGGSVRRDKKVRRGECPVAESGANGDNDEEEGERAGWGQSQLGGVREEEKEGDDLRGWY
jgi:hypothetical protein